MSTPSHPTTFCTNTLRRPPSTFRPIHIHLLTFRPLPSVLFIVSVLATAWATATLLRHDSTRRSALFVALIDLAFVGAFIAGVYELRGIASQNCSNASGGVTSSGGVGTSGDTVYISPLSINYTPFSLDVNKTCSMLKASFAFGIINCILFFVTFVMALFIHRHHRGVVVEKSETIRRRSHESR